MTDAWLVIVDPQEVFADPDSPWCCPAFDSIVGCIDDLSTAFGPRTVVTRWVPPTKPTGAWADYLQTWSFAADPTDPQFELVEAASEWSARETLDRPTFGKWGPELAAIVGKKPTIVLAGVATDCCIISTALAAADAGISVIIATDACTGSSGLNHDAALHIMSLYEPQIRLQDTAEILAAVQP